MSDSNGTYLGIEIGNYRITKEIDSGGSGTVYLAEHTILTERLVAIKLLHAHLSAAEDQKQFLQEAHLLERLKHVHILPIYDVGFYQTTAYLITEYAPGGSLRDRLDQNPGQPLPLEEALSILAQVGQALQCAHDQEIVHRDLKPENILFNAKREALLADFGIALEIKRTSVKERTIVGSFDYMAPEQCRGTISKEGDQYALGCIAYELVTGRVPFEASDIPTLLAMHITKPPDPPTTWNPQLPQDVETAILRALEKERQGRYPTLLEFLTALSPSARVVLAPTASTPSPPPIASAPLQAGKTKEQWLSEGHDQLRQGHRKKAFDAYEQATQLAPQDLEAQLCRGNAAYELHYYKKAIESYEQVLSQQPKHVEALTKKGGSLSEMKRHREALDAYDDALMLAPSDASLHYRRGRQLAHLRRYEEAVKAFEAAIGLKATVADYFSEQGNALAELKRHQEALGAYEQAIRLKPEMLLYQWQKAKMLHGLKRYDESLKLYDRLLREQYFGVGWKTELLSEKGQILYDLKRYEEALNIYTKALREKPKAKEVAGLLFQKGNSLFNLNRYEGAVESYDQMLKKQPFSPYAHVNRGHCLYNLKRYEEAIEAYQSAIRMFVNLVSVYKGLGDAYYALGRYQEALDAYEEAIERKPYEVRLLLGKAYCLEGLRRYKEALEAYERVLALDPNNASAYEGKGNVYGAWNYLLQAFFAYHKVLELRPGGTSLPNKRRQMLQRLVNAEHPDALAAYDALIAADPQQAQWYRAKGDFLQRLKRYAEALRAYEQALARDSSDVPARTGMQAMRARLAWEQQRVRAHTPRPLVWKEEDENEEGEDEDDEWEIQTPGHKAILPPLPQKKLPFWKRLLGQ
ncbi:MAG TPA: tetratricopeptide repeat protein [Ktedonosporobacter sp.]|nr:tetratricopeptide repeat protein [Ktedonosporobacter sp.]